MKNATRANDPIKTMSHKRSNNQMIKIQGFGTKDDSRARAGAIGRHARTSRSSTHVTEGKCPRSRSPTPPPRARFSSPSTYAINAVILASRPRDGCARSNGSSVRDRSIGGLDGGRSTSHFSRNRGEAQTFPLDGWMDTTLNDRTTEPTTTEPTEPTTRTTRTTRLT